jgi:polysaccharide biosynthesis/export protein
VPKILCVVVSACLLFRAVPSLAADSYRVQPGDVLIISVWKERDLQGEILVRPDGGFSFPLAGDVDADGKTTQELTEALVGKLKRFIPDPVVTVTVKQIGGNRVYVLGKVNRPGEFSFSKPVDVMQALALAGGDTVRRVERDSHPAPRSGSVAVAAVQVRRSGAGQTPGAKRVAEER